MVKDTVSGSSRESTIKKRRKTAVIDLDNEVDVYKKVIQFEEKEAFKRTPEIDTKLFNETCKTIRTLLQEMDDIRLKKVPDVTAKIAEKTVQVATRIIVLKKLNRSEKVRSTAAREALSTEKQKVDSTNLQYQNLMYEAAHLFSEYKKCKQFKSKDEDIELVPIEEFLKEAPDIKTKSFKNVSNLTDAQKHDLHLARLEWELTQRKKLAELCNTFEDEKKQVAADIVKIKNRLGGLAPKLVTVLESTKPLQEYLGLPVEKTYAEHKQASLLPNPLYVFFANVDAYKKVYDVDILLEIMGDQDEAIQWRQLQNMQFLQVDDSDQETETQEENTEVKKRRHRKASHVDRLEERKKRLLEPHPLSVQLTFKIKDGLVLKMNFQCRVALNIITVTSEIDCPSHLTGNFVKEVLSGESVLSELFDGDVGTISPNPSNPYQLKRVGFISYQSLVPKLGYAYLWAQNVCGLDFLQPQNNGAVRYPNLNDKNSAKISCTNVEVVLKAINKRLKSRMALAIQLQELEQNLIPKIPDNVELPCNSASSLSAWSSLTWQQFCSAPSTTDLIANELVGPSDLFYSATITRPKTATLITMIAIKNDYPKQSPIFSLTIKHNGEFHSQNSNDVRDMERTVNVGWSNNKASANWLLAAQICHLCAYFDVYLETVAASNCSQNTVFFKNICGRTRRRPFKFRKVGAGIFTQF